MMDMKSSYADVNESRLYYEISGSGDPIVLIHGGYCDLRIWDGQIQAFSAKHKLIRYDLRGYGKSALPEPNKSYKHHDDLKALLEHLDLPEAHICGHSFGSAVAADFALAYPELCKSLISEGPWVFGYSSPSAKALISFISKVDSVFKEKGKKAALVYFHADEDPTIRFHYNDQNLVNRLIEIGLDYSFWHHLHEDPVEVFHPIAIEQLDKISKPTLIITSNNDVEPCREIAVLMEQKIRNSTKVVIMDAGHDIGLNKPIEFNKAVLDFLSSLSL
ncbi:MAG: alpha/beta fold hydrolase [Candidatus Heimdallarchaeota archaeon]